MDYRTVLNDCAVLFITVPASYYTASQKKFAIFLLEKQIENLRQGIERIRGLLTQYGLSRIRVFNFC
jgi:hypothetical protein